MKATSEEGIWVCDIIDCVVGIVALCWLPVILIIKGIFSLISLI